MPAEKRVRRPGDDVGVSTEALGQALVTYCEMWAPYQPNVAEAAVLFNTTVETICRAADAALWISLYGPRVEPAVCRLVLDAEAPAAEGGGHDRLS